MIDPFPAGYIFFGENMIKHTINYGDVVPFVGFAAYDIDSELFLENWDEFFDTRDIPRVSNTFVRAEDVTQSYLNELADQPSAFGTYDVIVIKNYTTQTFGNLKKQMPRCLVAMSDTQRMS